MFSLQLCGEKFDEAGCFDALSSINSDWMHLNVMQHVKVNDCNHGQVPWLIIGWCYTVVFNLSLCSSAASSLGYGMRMGL